MRKKRLVYLLFFTLCLPVLVFGQTIPNPGPDSLSELVNGIVVFVRNLALAIAPIIFLIAGFMYYFAGGDPKKAQNATNLIKWAVVGLVIILIANGITMVITDIMGVDGP